MAKQYQLVMSSIARLSRRYNATILDQMIEMPGLSEEEFRDSEEWFNRLLERLNSLTSEQGYTLSLQKAPDGKLESVTVGERRHGGTVDYLYSAEFFATPEYREIRTLSEQLDGLIGVGAYVQRGERKREIRQFSEAFEWLMNEAKRGQHIQRYKGLGEMNPDQLWETTMNPDSRRMLQVQIEDAIAADEIFTTLMGDQVEPRRDFIEQNALYVSNLDV
jgi:DNA gyrase subunit B